MAPYVKGRMTIRKDRGMTHQTPSKMIELWDKEPKPGTTLAKLGAAYLAGIQSFDAVEAKKREHAASGKFTDAGLREAVLQTALTGAVPGLHRARQTVKLAKAEVADRRSKLKVTGPDPMDLAGAMRRQELRHFLREMKPEEQSKYFHKHGDKLPADVAMAVLEMPPEFSGVPETRHKLLSDVALKIQFGDGIESISELERGIELAERSVEASRDEIRQEAGVTQQAFDELAEPFVRKVDAPWVKPHTENGVEVLRTLNMDAKAWTVSTPEEIANGIVAKTRDEYEARKVTA